MGFLRHGHCKHVEALALLQQQLKRLPTRDQPTPLPAPRPQPKPLPTGPIPRPRPTCACGNDAVTPRGECLRCSDLADDRAARRLELAVNGL
jgi:hypothetical protein